MLRDIILLGVEINKSTLCQQKPIIDEKCCAVAASWNTDLHEDARMHLSTAAVEDKVSFLSCS